MKKYKQIIEKDSEGNQTVVAIIDDSETVKVIKKINPQQQAILNQKDTLKNTCSKLGGFIHVCYVKNELLFNKLGLNKPTISRILYLATYIDYNNRESNVLVRYGKNKKIKYLTIDEIKKLLKLSDRTFIRFIKEIKEKELLFECNNKLYLSDKYFEKGKCNFNKDEYTRLFISPIRHLYENCNVSQHKNLSDVLQLIPYLDRETNVIKIDGKPSDIKDIMELLGFSTKGINTINNFKKKMLQFNITYEGKKYYLFGALTIEYENKKRTAFVVNPYVLYGGNNIPVVNDVLVQLLTE